jgi:hypothetical protein
VRAKTAELIDTARDILSEHRPMTVRQLYYQLVSRQVIKNNRSEYQAVSNAIVKARLAGMIPWSWIEDRTRKPRQITMWDGLEDYAATCRDGFRLNVWPGQSQYVEIWLEKDALSGIFEDVLSEYGLTLNVGRGYDGWDSIHNAAVRFRHQLDSFEKQSTILYFGDFDPSGEDMVRSLGQRLGELGAYPEITKCALTLDDIERYSLPPDFAKKTDTRSTAFIEKNGDVSVELDALPNAVLKDRLVREIEDRIDVGVLEQVKEQEQKHREKLVELLKDVA